MEGASSMIQDFLFSKRFEKKSILILGEPGFALRPATSFLRLTPLSPTLVPARSGKTTIVRSMAKILSEHKNVVVVDTSNEIAGSPAD
jgi:hypothetical protein